MSVQTEGRRELEVRAGEIAGLAERSFREFDTEAVREQLEERIRARPILSVLTAAVAGFFVGRMLRS